LIALQVTHKQPRALLTKIHKIQNSNKASKFKENVTAKNQTSTKKNLQTASDFCEK
jgi:hypothetical protein